MVDPNNVIPSDLREELRADAEKAERNGDRACATILRQIAGYTGADGPGQARALKVNACTIRYEAARKLMKLVLAAEDEGRRRRPGS